MENDRKLALKKKANDILANLNISTITDEIKIITFIQELKEREIEDNEVEILEKTLNNIKIYLHTKKLMQIETDDYNYLKEIAEILRKQNVRIKDEQVVEYAMSRSMSPTMVSQYTLKQMDKKLLEEKLKEINDIVEENNNKE